MKTVIIGLSLENQEKLLYIFAGFDDYPIATLEEQKTLPQCVKKMPISQVLQELRG